MLKDHARIIWALMLREIATRYGRDNLGFLWVICEPLVFCVGVLILWRSIRGQYENGIGVVPFVMTGYMPTILVRHIAMYSINSIRVNSGLLYHKSITVLDLFSSRIILEFFGVSLAFFVVYSILGVFSLIELPRNIGLVYEGWIILGFSGAGLALILGAISELFEVVERIISVTLYILVPLSGTFYMVDWLPPDVQRLALLMPFLDCTEMIRSGVFGSAVVAHYDVGYTVSVSCLMIFIGLLLMRHIRDRVEVI